MNSHPSQRALALNKVRRKNVLGCLAALLVLSGCPEDTAQTGEPEVVETGSEIETSTDAGVSFLAEEVHSFHPLFRPQDGHTPYPMDGLLHESNLWRDSLPETIQTLAGFASRGHGFPTTQIITIPFSQKPLISTLSGNLLILDVDSEAPLEGTYTWDAARKELVFHPRAALAREVPTTLVSCGYHRHTVRRGRGARGPGSFFGLYAPERLHNDCASFFPDYLDQQDFAARFGFSEDNLAFAYRVSITAHTEVQGSVFFSQGAFPDDTHWKRDDGRTFAPEWLYPQEVATITG